MRPRAFVSALFLPFPLNDPIMGAGPPRHDRLAQHPRRGLLWVGTVLTALATSASLAGQTAAPAPSSSSPQAIQTLQQALSAAGGAQALGSIQDFSATGTITYFWAGEQVQGSATVKARGTDQFRVDSVLPEGTRAWLVNRGTGTLKETDGTTNPIPYYDAVNLGAFTFPYLSLVSATNDPLANASFVGGVQTSDGKQADQIHLQWPFSSADDPQGLLAQLRTTDYLVDAATDLLISTSRTMYAIDNFSRTYVDEVDFQNYAPVSGVQVPMLVQEKMNGQTAWQLTLTSIAFNTGLTDADFLLP